MRIEGFFKIPLINTPVKSIASVATHQQENTDYENINPGLYYLLGDSVSFKEPYHLMPKETMRITYTGGYVIHFGDQDTHTLPQEVEMACLRLSTCIFNRRKSEGASQVEFQSSDVSYQKACFSDDIKGLLSMYKVVAPFAV